MRLKTGQCLQCPNKRAKVGYFTDGEPKYSRLCNTCRKRKYDRASFLWKRENKDTVCGECGFESEHLCQMDIDHVIPIFEGGENDDDNLQTLCANCHRLKSYEERVRANLHHFKKV